MQLRASLASLATRLASAAGEPTEDADVARDGRKVSAAVQQTLDRLQPPDIDDNRDAAARTLLGAAAEDNAWAWRMVESRAGSPALAAAAAVLAEHAVECCDQAEMLLGETAGGEPGVGE